MTDENQYKSTECRIIININCTLVIIICMMMSFIIHFFCLHIDIGHSCSVHLTQMYTKQYNEELIIAQGHSEL